MGKGNIIWCCYTHSDRNKEFNSHFGSDLNKGMNNFS